jgi:hypothetical protein
MGGIRSETPSAIAHIGDRCPAMMPGHSSLLALSFEGFQGDRGGRNKIEPAA